MEFHQKNGMAFHETNSKSLQFMQLVELCYLGLFPSFICFCVEVWFVWAPNVSSGVVPETSSRRSSMAILVQKHREMLQEMLQNDPKKDGQEQEQNMFPLRKKDGQEDIKRLQSKNSLNIKSFREASQASLETARPFRSRPLVKVPEAALKR